jgi:NifU-like protein involved in Fe-S cluster formation
MRFFPCGLSSWRPAAYIMRDFGLQGEQVDQTKQDIRMTLPEDIYSQRILELAAAIPRTARLEAPHASATAHSKLCGSTVSVDLAMEGDIVTDYGQSVKACLLGQSSASVMGREIVGSNAAELRAVGAAMRKMLKQGGPPPSGKWGDLAVLEPVRDYRARHASTLLVFDAVEDAIGQIEAKRAKRAGKMHADQAEPA